MKTPQVQPTRKLLSALLSKPIKPRGENVGAVLRYGKEGVGGGEEDRRERCEV
jgi:hypothetical protein